jgi:hypothetical protein
MAPMRDVNPKAGANVPPENATAAGAPRYLHPQPAVLIASACALLAGCAIAWMDTRSTWDHPALTAAALLVVGGASAFARVPAWLAALLVAGPLVIAEPGAGSAAVLAVAFAAAGACGGALLRRRARAR